MKIMLYTRYITALIALLIASAASAQSPELPQVSLITCGPGADNYTLEGHTALRLRYPTGADYAVNWGIFDFSAPNFAYRFIKGETDYMIGIEPFAYFVEAYRANGRSLVEQRLAMTDEQKQALVELIEDNLRPENRTYRYNYVRDNCSTRPLAILEKALAADGSGLSFDLQQQPTTWRQEMRRYHSRFPAYQLFIDIVLGSGIDQPIGLRQQAYAPLFLQTLIGSASVVDADGNQHPFVTDQETLAIGGQPADEGWLSPWYVVALLTLGSVWVTVRDLRRRRVTRWFDALFYLIFALWGLLVAFLIFVSTHEATSPNYNFLWLNPLSLIVPLLIGFRKCKKIVFWYQIANFVAVVLFSVAYPFMTQVGNWMFVPLIISDLLLSGRYLYLNRQLLPNKK